jgi:DNA-binding response OmpR family regulator
MDFSPSTILVIADHLTSRSRLCQILNQAGYSNVLGADSEQQALATLSSFLENQENKEGTGAGVDLIIVDLGDPEMAGVATFRKLKGASQTAEIPVIMVTAASKGAPLVDALAQEDMDYVTRPVEQLELLSRVKKALQLKKEIEQRKELAQKLAEANKRVQGHSPHHCQTTRRPGGPLQRQGIRPAPLRNHRFRGLRRGHPGHGSGGGPQYPPCPFPHQRPHHLELRRCHARPQGGHGCP